MLLCEVTLRYVARVKIVGWKTEFIILVIINCPSVFTWLSVTITLKGSNL